MKTSDKIRNPTFGTDDPVLIPHEFLIAMSNEVVKLEDELADYKKHFEPQMIQLRLHRQAVAHQEKTYRVAGESE